MTSSSATVSQGLGTLVSLQAEVDEAGNARLSADWPIALRDGDQRDGRRRASRSAGPNPSKQLRGQEADGAEQDDGQEERGARSTMAGRRRRRSDSGSDASWWRAPPGRDRRVA